MKTIKIYPKEEYTIVQLDRGKANAINSRMVRELRETFRKLQTDESVKGVIITGKEHFFSAGFDLIDLYDYNYEQVKDFWTGFFVLMVEMCAFPKPLIAAISGHSPAGGCVLAFCCDYRIMADGKYYTGMNEISVGIVVPDSLFKLYSYWIGRRKAYQFLTEGRLFLPNEALANQLVDKVVTPEFVMDEAKKKMQHYLTFDPDAWQKSKLHLRGNLLEALRVDFEFANRDTLEQWWSPKARTILKEIATHLKERKKKDETVSE